MVSCIRGNIKFYGAKAEIMADITTLIEALLNDNKIDIGDVMEIMSVALGGAGVKIINGGEISARELHEIIDELENCEDCDECDMEEVCENFRNLNNPKEESSDFTADDIFKNFFNE